MNPQKEIELGQKINALVAEISELPEMQQDKEFQKDLQYFSDGLRWLLVNRVVKYEYGEYYLAARKRKMKGLVKKMFAKNPTLVIAQETSC